MSNNFKVAIGAKVNNSNNIKASVQVKTSSKLKADITPVISGISGVRDHSRLNNLDYEASGHKGFASQKELQNYAEKAELPISISNLEIENILGGN